MAFSSFPVMPPTVAQRLRAVVALLHGTPAAQVATQFGCCRSDLYKWRRRALVALAAALADQSRGPTRPHNRLPPDQETEVAALCARYPTWSASRIQRRLGPQAPPARTIQRIRQRHALARVPQREAPRRQVSRFTRAEKQRVHEAIQAHPSLGALRLAWDLRNREQLRVSPATITRLKRALYAAQYPPTPRPVWRFYERHHPHSLWHGDFMEKVVLADTGRRAYQLTLQDDYSRAYVFCDLLLAQTVQITLRAVITAMRQWRVIPTALLFDNGGHFRGAMLRAFCQRLGIALIYTAVHHPQTNGKLERAFRDDMRDFYQPRTPWLLDQLRRELPAYVHYRNTIRGHLALGGQPASTRLREQHRMALPWVLDRLEQYADVATTHVVLPARGFLRMFERDVVFDLALAGREVTLYETLEGLEMRAGEQRLGLFRDYQRWRQQYFRYRGETFPDRFTFEPCVSGSTRTGQEPQGEQELCGMSSTLLPIMGEV